MNAIDRQLLRVENDIAVREARVDFLAFVKLMAEHPMFTEDFTRTTYEVKPHHIFMAKVFQDVADGHYDGKYVLISLPPRAGKSHLMKHFVAWCAGRDATQHAIYATYNNNFAADIGSEVREIMKHPRFRQVFPEFRFQKGRASSDFMRTDKKGEIKFSGEGGSITGKGGHKLLADDMFKDAEDAASVVRRDKKWDWFMKTFRSRVMNDRVPILFTMTRWHEDDIIGRLTDPTNPAYNPKFAKRCVVINIPAIANDNDPLGRKKGQVLWPERFGEEYLRELEETDPRGFSALYQGKPTPADGDFFRRKNLRFYLPNELPARSDLRIFATSDHAVSGKQRADYTVLLIAGVDEHENIYVLDVFWDKVTSDVVVEEMINRMEHWKPQFWWAEKGHISKSIGPFLKKRMLERKVFVAVEEVTPSADKTTRAQPIQGRMSMGKVLFPKNASWANRAVDELMKFPNGTHDDFVDALSWLGIHLPRVFAPSNSNTETGPKPGTFGYLKKQYARQAMRDRRAKIRSRM